jgi:hypothetical protein
MKQLFCLMLFCASIFIVSCNKETADVTNSTGIETQKLSANSISLDEAKATYLKAAKEARSSVVGGTPLNLADFDPQWSQVDGSNFVDTSGNALTVPTTAFEPGGYKKLVFFRNNGQTTFLVATMLGTPEYLTRKNGICTMNDFCGFIIYTNLDGISTGGYKLDNGVTVGNLIPKTTPRPEWTFLDQLLDEFTVRSGPSGGGGRGGSSAASFGIFNAMMFSNLTTFNNNTFGFGSGNSGSPDNSSMNGNAPPPVNANLCPTTFVVTDNVPNGTKDMGVRGLDLVMTLPGIGSQTVGFSGLNVLIPRVNLQTNQVVTDADAAQIAATAINSAQNQLQNKLDAGTVSPTQAAMKREFQRLASINIDIASGITSSNPPAFRVTWEPSSFISGQLMAYRTAVTGCP